MAWKDYFKNSYSKIEFIVTLLVLVLTLIFLTRFLDWVELRNGVVLNDPVLKLFKPVNLSWLIFLLIYLSLFTGIISFIKKPEILLLAVQSYIILIVLRVLVMFLLPLNPPEKSILLVDPVVKYFGTGKNLTKDLFFSGHTATLFLLFLAADKKYLKVIFLAGTIIVAICLLLQHVHYSIDVTAAFFFSYSSYKIAKFYRNKTISVFQ